MTKNEMITDVIALTRSKVTGYTEEGLKLFDLAMERLLQSLEIPDIERTRAIVESSEKFNFFSSVVKSLVSSGVIKKQDSTSEMRKRILRELEDRYEGYQIDSFEKRIRHLGRVQIESLLLIVENLETYVEYRDFVSQLEMDHLLKVTPKIVYSEDGIPALMFRHDKFLSWFRGYRFQVSGTSEGVGDYGSSDTSMQMDLRISKFLPKNLRPLVAISHICQAGSKYPDLREIILDVDSGLFEGFINSTERVESINCKDFSSTDFWMNFKSYKNLPDGEIFKKLALCEGKSRARDYDACFATVVLADRYIAIRRYETGLWNVFEFPPYEKSRDEDWDSPSYDTKVGDHYHQSVYYSILFQRILWVMCVFEGIVLDRRYVYPERDRGLVKYIDSSLLGLDSGNIALVKNANEFYSAVNACLKEDEIKRSRFF